MTGQELYEQHYRDPALCAGVDARSWHELSPRLKRCWDETAKSIVEELCADGYHYE